MNNADSSQNEEHILVCLSSSPTNAKIIRTASQMSRAFGGRFTALYVKTAVSENISRENRERLNENIKLAQMLGAEPMAVCCEDVALGIIEFARLSKVTKVVFGRSGVKGSSVIKRQTLTDRIIKEAPELDFYIIPDGEAERKAPYYNTAALLQFPSLKQWLLMLFVLFLSTMLGFVFHTIKFTGENTITVYLLGGLISALLTKNYICSGVFSMASVLLFNFFFTEPRMSFIAYDSGYPVTFAIMLIASLITGTLANKVAANAKLSADSANRTNIMLKTNQLLQKAENEKEITEIIATQLLKLLSRSVVVYSLTPDGLDDGAVFPLDSSDAELLRSSNEKVSAEEILDKFESSNYEFGLKSKSSVTYFPIKTSDTLFSVVGIVKGNKNIEHFENSILISVLGEAALAIENLRNAKEKEEIAVLAENERMRANLLRAISHDLRTPLTSISGNAENLLANYDSIDKETRTQILKDVSEDAEWLILLVENLLSVSRISEGRMNINMSSQLVEEVITEAVKHIKNKTGDHELLIEYEESLLLAKMDARLISQVIINLVDNAVKYTPRGSLIKISAKSHADEVRISVSDNGFGIPDSQKQNVFKMFYTGKNEIADCRRSLGLGLSLCESIVNAHGGKIYLTDNTPSGCIFTFTLKKSEVKLYE